MREDEAEFERLVDQGMHIEGGILEYLELERGLEAEFERLVAWPWPELRPEGAQISLLNCVSFGPNCTKVSPLR